ncbi:haloacid dehalogenase-like hydrolase [Sporomusa malonica]|uniref:DUF7916 domain-containing protein n=1 Tax=Sporomusa malonica TaxID=112901 RepID=A0A1W1ZRW1_9FIRM|nr:haloacid dehalogenase-like hydrolase [Sporomusa malonica]SMC50821.1 hypothetical protein SAMN04488500_104129 [Sporomusa malonica]
MSIARILDLRPEELVKVTARDLLAAIRAAEGRTILAEVICPVMPILYDVGNAELVAAMGADIILLNLYNAQQPAVFGLSPVTGQSVIDAVKGLIGRPVGVNLEAVDWDSDVQGERVKVERGRLATPENARLAYEQGACMITVTGNPGTGVTNSQIKQAVTQIRAELGENIIITAGKMHAAGVGGGAGDIFLSQAEVGGFLSAGADIILIPAPGTIPGITVDSAREVAAYVHGHGGLVMTAVGTSQEGADTQTIRTIALNAKMAGADIHHIGDSGYMGIAVPENIMNYSIAVRGRRHTFRRMAMRV